MRSSSNSKNPVPTAHSLPTMAVVLSKHARALVPGPVDSLIAGLQDSHSLFVYDPGHTLDPSELTDISKTAAYKGTLVIGGDGTLNWALNILGTDRPFAVFPAGTANDLATHQGLAQDVEGTLAAIQSGNTVNIDLIRVNGVLFATAGGGGLPADCALWISQFRSRGPFSVRTIDRLGPLAYQLAAAGNILFRPRTEQTLTISLEQEEHEGGPQKLVLCSSGFLVTNQGTLAGRLRVAPASLNNDGLFEVFVLPSASRSRLLRILLGLRTGSFSRSGDFRFLRSNKAMITCQNSTRFFGDGELLAEGKEFFLGIEQGALKLFCPNKAQGTSGSVWRVPR